MKMYHENCSEEFLKTIQTIAQENGQIEVAGKYFMLSGFSVSAAYYGRYDIELTLYEVPVQKIELPEEFEFTAFDQEKVYSAKIVKGTVYVTWEGMYNDSIDYPLKEVEKFFSKNSWKFVPPKSEKEFQLEQSIKLHEQTIEHEKRMIGNLKAKLEEAQKERLKGV